MTEGQQLELVGCGNCGHAEEMTEDLAEIGFTWIDENTCKTSCPGCGSYVIMRSWSFENGYPVGGEMLVVKTTLKPKGAIKNERH